MSGVAQCHVESLAEAFGVSPEAARAALDRHGGDADAAAEELLTIGAPEHPGGGHTGSGHAAAGGGALGMLMDMGYPRREAEQALAAAGGDMDVAIGRLLDMEGPTGSSAAPAASDSAGAADVDDCAICCEPIRPMDAAMRCTGHGGAHHYGHAKCLASWVQRCRSTGTAPTCPTCRQPVQMNPRNLRDFLQQKPPDSSGQSDVLRSMLEQSHDDDCSDCWQTIDCDRIVVGVAVAGAVIAAGFAAKAIFDAFTKDKRRD